MHDFVVQVSRRVIVPTVMAQHIVQGLLGLALLDTPMDVSQRTLSGEFLRFLGAMVVLDAWQYAFHRLFHEVDWLYDNIHIWHHRMYIPHAYGALYQHPVEMVIMDTLSGMVAVAATGASPCSQESTCSSCQFAAWWQTATTAGSTN
jgi:sphinganine C4-monooxygenase